MDERTDWLMDDDNDDLLDENGDYIEGPSAIQEAWLAVYTVPGENRQFPTAGFGIDMRLKKRVGESPTVENMVKFKRDLRLVLEDDGHKNPEIIVNEDLSVFQIKVKP